ncbi:MAG: HipA domain-containing protein [Armatimonadetes bacterium]|nr:HipA domain-containing protein [Armatimonadota bacterium]
MPEGLRLDALQRRVKTSRSDLFGLLMQVGDETVGDVTVVPAGEEKSVKRAVKLQKPLDFGSIKRSILGLSDDLPDSGIPGVMVKLFSARLTTPIPGTSNRKPFLLKFEDPAYPKLATNECAVMSLAAKCGLPVAKTKVIRDAHGEEALVVERFDRVRSGTGSMEKVHVEDACQFLDRYPADKYNLSLSEVAAGISKFASSPIPEVLRLVVRYSFSYLVGDSDQHAKNISLWRSPTTGLIELSPVYDVVCSLPYQDLNQRSALSMDGRDCQFKIKHMVAFGARFDVSEEAITQKLSSLAQNVAQRLDDAFAQAKWPYDTDRVINIVRERNRRFLTN